MAPVARWCLPCGGCASSRFCAWCGWTGEAARGSCWVLLSLRTDRYAFFFSLSFPFIVKWFLYSVVLNTKPHDEHWTAHGAPHTFIFVYKYCCPRQDNYHHAMPRRHDSHLRQQNRTKSCNESEKKIYNMRKAQVAYLTFPLFSPTSPSPARCQSF